MTDIFDEEFFVPFLPLQDSIVKVLQHSYDVAREHYDEELEDSSVFGLEVYKRNVSGFVQLTDALESPLQMKSKRPKFRMALGRLEVSCYKVGRNAKADIWRSFPNPGASADGVEVGQLVLEGMDPYLSLEKVVISHIGNPEEGLLGVYLCEPSRAEGREIVEWRRVHKLWSIEDGVPIADVQLTGLPPAVDQPEPLVRPKEKKKRVNE